MLQATAIQCRNPAATQCRKTSAEEKNDSTPLHVAAGPDTVYQDFLCTATRFWCSCKKAIAPSRMVWDGLESSQNKTYCVHSKSPMILLPTSLAQVLITFLPILETRRRNLQGRLKIASFRWNVRVQSRSKRHPNCGTK